MFKRKSILLLSSFLVLNAFLLSAYTFHPHREQRETVRLELPNREWTVGERLVFDVFWMGIPIGIGQLEVLEKAKVGLREAYHVVAIAKTNDFLSKIYPIEDEIHSFIDAGKFRSLEFRKKLREGRYRADERIVYDYEKKKGTYESYLNGGKKEVEIGADVHDFLSAFYWFRLQNIPVGQAVRTVVNSEEKNWDLELKVLRQETKELKGGRVIETIVVEPKTGLKGILYDRGRAWVHFSVDKKRVPVWIRIQTPWGPVVGVLRMESKGTWYPGS